MLNNNFLALIITFILALIWLRICDFAARRGWINSHLSRKIIHIGTGPIFVTCWLLFSDAASSRFIAALVPLSITAQFAFVGLGLIRDDSAVKAMSRSGDRREILRGPLYYGIIFVFVTIIFWTASPTGMVALMLMCGGDGLADILGRKYGNAKLPWNSEKSYIGALGMFVGGWVLSVIIVLLYHITGFFPEPFITFLIPISVIALVGTAVETLPLKDIDNITVTLSAIILGCILF
jgi:phytol kinase